MAGGQPGSKVVCDAIGEAASVDHPIARPVIIHIERFIHFHSLVLYGSTSERSAMNSSVGVNWLSARL